jgi:hypothetical protein
VWWSRFCRTICREVAIRGSFSDSPRVKRFLSSTTLILPLAFQPFGKGIGSNSAANMNGTQKGVLSTGRTMTLTVGISPDG